jgi:succinate dehydrogenase / fumarate reductase cytochrome b subunit
MKQMQPRQNYLGAGGWVWAGKYKLERYLYLLHRVTGLGLLLFGVIHLIMTTFFRIQGQDLWESTISVLHNPVFKVGAYVVVVGFVFHALNGLRLILQEFGFTLGRPIPPIYPYKDALRKKRPWAVIIIAVVGIIAVVFLYDFISGGW